MSLLILSKSLINSVSELKDPTYLEHLPYFRHPDFVDSAPLWTGHVDLRFWKRKSMFYLTWHKYFSTGIFFWQHSNSRKINRTTTNLTQIKILSWITYFLQSSNHFFLFISIFIIILLGINWCWQHSLQIRLLYNRLRSLDVLKTVPNWIDSVKVFHAIYECVFCGVKCKRAFGISEI